jgi:hypothetical protein
MAGNTYRTNCANAQQPGCVCSGCGGSLHGQKGWRDIATEPLQVRADLRRDFEARLQTDARSRKLRPNADNRLACLNLARLDIADFLWRDADGHPEMPEAVNAVAGDSAESPYVTVSSTRCGLRSLSWWRPAPRSWARNPCVPFGSSPSSLAHQLTSTPSSIDTPCNLS